LNTLNVEYRKVEALIPYARNPRTHTERRSPRSPPASSSTAGRIRSWSMATTASSPGHGRLAAARKLGLDQVPVIELAHLTPRRKRAYCHRRQPAGAGRRLGRGNAGAGTGRAVRSGIRPGADRLRGCIEIEACSLTSALEDESAEDEEERCRRADATDDVPDAPVVPVSRPGDVWAIGSHRLICGDATDPPWSPR
jgi:hypothetical protein